MAPISMKDSLAITHPEIASLLVRIYNKDGSISKKTSQDVRAGSKLKAEFRCPKPELGHGTSLTEIYSKARGTGCLTCAKQRVEAGINDIETTHPEVASLVVCIYKNGIISDKTVKEVSAGSNLKAEFRCPNPELKHDNSVSTIKDRTRGRGCPACGRISKAEKQSKGKLKSKPKTKIHPELASQILWIYEKDGTTRSTLSAEEVSAGSDFKAEWICGDLGLQHSSYKARIADRARGSGCPTCAGRRIEIGINDLATLNPLIASELLFIYNTDGKTISDKTAKNVALSSRLKAEWSCSNPELGHSSYTASINSRTSKSAKQCPTCTGRRVEFGINDLLTLEPVVSSQLVCIYNKDGSISTKTAKDVSAISILNGEWKCDSPELNHPSYISMIWSRTNGMGCPLCAKGKTERTFTDSFSRNSNNSFSSARLRLERKLFVSGVIQVDMLCEKINLAIEYDGAWVHGGVNNPNKELTIEDCIARDTDSTLALLESGLKVIRIREHSKTERLPFIDVPEEYANNLYQITYKSFGKDKNNIDDLVKYIIKTKHDWFDPQTNSSIMS